MSTLGEGCAGGSQVGVQGRQLLKGSDYAVKGPNKEHLLILLKDGMCAVGQHWCMDPPHCHHPQGPHTDSVPGICPRLTDSILMLSFS